MAPRSRSHNPGVPKILARPRRHDRARLLPELGKPSLRRVRNSATRLRRKPLLGLKPITREMRKQIWISSAQNVTRYGFCLNRAAAKVLRLQQPKVSFMRANRKEKNVPPRDLSLLLYQLEQQYDVIADMPVDALQSASTMPAILT